jgi:hypothetical protein
MKVIKLDRRYAGFPEWKYACQFPLRNHQYRKQYFEYKKAFRELYGDDARPNPEYHTAQWGSVPKWIYNEHWRSDYKRQRILVKDQALVSMIMLKMPS